MTPARSPRPRGFTLVELVMALGITAVVVMLLTSTMIALDRNRRVREVVTTVQGDGRAALEGLTADLRGASLGATTGVVWSDAGGARVARPAIQIFDRITGGGTLAAIDVKAGTDALLVVAARPGRAGAVTVGDSWQSTSPIGVTDVAPFAVGDRVLLGEYVDAAWDTVQTIVPDARQLTLSSTVNVFPGMQTTKLAAGAIVRPARARLYFVDTADELVRVELAVPRPPASAADVVTREVIARGVENLQLDCGVGDALAACPAPQAGALATESAASFGPFAAGAGPRLDAGSIPGLRTVLLSIALRSLRPVDAAQGDAKVVLDGAVLPVGGADDAASYVRRVYRLGVSVRNTSLGVL
jgi:prepilin-type N-terminal cleavage/methylation domain-containing protein